MEDPSTVLPGARRALADVSVVELGSGVGGAFCARLFADYGADVIKLEPPGCGDPTRSWGPFPGDRPDPEKSGTFLFLNTNKRSVALDVDIPSDRERLLALVGRADVLVSSLRPRQLRDQGLDYATLSKLNPDLVMISLTPFGQTGPYADWNGYDLNAYHLSGCGSRYCGQPDEAPLEHGTFSAEFFAGYVAAAWGLACLSGRERAGGGQHVDVSSAEALAALFVGALNVGGYAQDGVFDRRGGAGMGLAAPADILPCKDGHVLMIALETRQWKGLGDPEWARVDLFDDMWELGRNSDFIYEMLQLWTMQHSKEEIMQRCQAQGCPATAIYSVADLLQHPHLKQRGYLVELDHPRMGRVLHLGAPIRLPATPGGPVTAAPLLGQHDEEVFGASADGPGGTPSGRAAPPRLSLPRAAERSDDEGGRALPLAGIRVANFGWGLVGPTAGQLLAFLGADVYKIESHARPDIQRTVPPFFNGIRDPDRSIQNHAFWAGNRSITLNLKTAEGQDLARQLVAVSDVVIENFAVGVMARFGLGYETLREVAPEIIMASLSSAGSFGPLAGLRTYGNSLAGLAGLDSVTGYAGGSIQSMENAYTDPLGGVVGALGILLALHSRAHDGKGQHVDFSQLEGTMQLVGPAFMDCVLNQRVAGPIGNRHPVAAAAPHGVFRCRGEDRWIAIAVANDEEWRGLVRALEGCEWARAATLADAAGRIRQIDALHERLSEWTREFDDYELATRLQRFGVAATPVLDVSDLLGDAHYRARGTFIEVVHPLGFQETIYGAYVKTSRTKPDIRPGPAIGADNEHVFKQLLGMSESRYRDLVERQVIY